mgnify:FL=1
MFDVYYVGQRDPYSRLRVLAQHYNWQDKVILDLGCNQGGMLLNIAHNMCNEDFGQGPIRRGVGVDGHSLLINCATALSHAMKCESRVTFFTWNFDGDDGQEHFVDGIASDTRVEPATAWSIRRQHAFIDNFLPTDGVDCIFLLSMCQWVRDPRNLHDCDCVYGLLQ